jgi:hypothetical protein
MDELLNASFSMRSVSYQSKILIKLALITQMHYSQCRETAEYDHEGNNNDFAGEDQQQFTRPDPDC